MDRNSQIAKINALIYELGAAFEEMDDVDYKIEVESYDEYGHHIVGAQDSNNWERSWC